MTTTTTTTTTAPTLEDSIFLDDKLGINCSACGAGRDGETGDKAAFAEELREDGWTVAAAGAALCPSCDGPGAAWGSAHVG